MTEYRIKKETTSYGSFSYDKYFPQQKLFGLFWYNLFESEYCSGSYDTFEEAQEHLCNYLRKPVVEYIDFDCERDCK